MERIIVVPPEEQDWRPLFAPSEFFTQFGHYLALDVMSPSAAVHESWLGFVESKVGAERREWGGWGQLVACEPPSLLPGGATVPRGGVHVTICRIPHAEAASPKRVRAPLPLPA